MSELQRFEFDALEYDANADLTPVRIRMEGQRETGWQIHRNGALHLELGEGYVPVRTRCCGVCSTDLDRHFLPFPLPQITGHELVGLDPAGRRVVVEINASHRARGDVAAGDCPFCGGGLPTHCPQRLVLGIHDLPGGFGPVVLAPEGAVLPLPDALPDSAAVLIEPFAAALNAAECVAPRAGERIAVLGPRRLGALVIAALASLRRRSGTDFELVALSRHESLRALARSLGADHCPAAFQDDLHAFDVVVDTTASPDGLDLAIRLARREVHLKSTHGQPAQGLERLTELVVDELALSRLPSTSEDAPRLPRDPAEPLVLALGGAPVPSWLRDRARIVEAEQPLAARRALAETASREGLPRAHAVIVRSLEAIDRAIRPSPDDEEALVRPRGEIWLAGGVDGDANSPLARAVARRGLRLSSSRCGRFADALELMANDPSLARLGERMITHRFPAAELRAALAKARSRESIKVLVEHRAQIP